MKLDKILSDVKEKIINATTHPAVYLGLFVGAIGFGAKGAEELWIRGTTKSVKEYNIHINDIDTVRTGSINTYYFHINGDTTGIVGDLNSHGFQIGKDYNCRIRRYGLVFDDERIENVKEIKLE